MKPENTDSPRRTLLKALLALGFGGPALSSLLHASGLEKILKPIPSSGESLPVLGVGSSRTFDALHDEELMARLAAVMQAFFDQGGTLIDSSPMYGTAQEVIGRLLAQVKPGRDLFAATKVWVDGRREGVEQMERSRQLWGIERFDLMQIHNLRDWKPHLQTLNAMKAEGRIRYTGITTSHGRSHAELERLLSTQRFDFVQLSYNIANRGAEQRLLPTAQDRGIAVIVNRPYQRGDLFAQVRGKPLPDWAAEIDVGSWGQFFLKFIVSHPGVTCAIPATSKARHMVDNMGAQFGRLPDQHMRREMIRYFDSTG